MSSPIPEEVNRVLTSAPFIASLGIQLESVGRGECSTVLPLAHQHLQQDGFVHAGVQATMADHTAGAAAASLVAKGQLVLTVEFKINFLRSAKGPRLLCRSKVLKSGAQLTVVESEVLCGAPGKERLVSKA
ncbi:MAG: phenylacetic acid degradation protein PaaI, partial [Acidobacteria bacterium RBG_16_68_9]